VGHGSVQLHWEAGGADGVVDGHGRAGRCYVSTEGTVAMGPLSVSFAPEKRVAWSRGGLFSCAGEVVGAMNCWQDRWCSLPTKENGDMVDCLPT